MACQEICADSTQSDVPVESLVCMDATGAPSALMRRTRCYDKLFEAWRAPASLWAKDPA